jgi:hypothetical protein
MEHVRNMLRSVAVALPLAAAGSLIAHQLAYRVAVDPHRLEHELAATGHSYLEHLTLVGALLAALAVAALALAIADAGRGRTPRRVAAWPFAVIPPAAFTAQEHLERLVHDGRVPWHAATERTFAAGLILQLPFALLAYLGVGVVLAAAKRVGAAIARRIKNDRRVGRSLRAGQRPDDVAAPVIAALALGYGKRGPPLSARP